jgi:uncharacterized membrane protein YpjA
MLHSLFWINFLGTIYGFYWYWGQLQDTVATKPLWMVILVPDSPTASLFFTLTLLYLLADSYAGNGKEGGRRADGPLRRIIEGVAVVSSFKYGIWAVVMIVAADVQGTPAGWQDWLLSFSHLGMAAEALLFARFFRLTPSALFCGALWVFASDVVDYRYEVYPYLPDVLVREISWVQVFTYSLSVASIVMFAAISRFTRLRRKRGN